MTSTNINPDLQKERSSASFDVEKLTEVIYGGQSMVKRRRQLQNLVFEDKYLNSFTKPWCNRTREEHYDIAVKKSVYMNKLIADNDVTNGIETFFIREASAPQEANPLGLHQVMFLPTIEKLGTKEQIKKYATPARQYKIIGTYAQTELGHGTFIRGLETTATYDPKTEEFIINSPTLSSMKYWPGGLGKTSNYVVLMAQLYSRGKCHGIHSFVVQIRSLEDHKPMPGVTVGDIGNKMGYDAMDNGFLFFENYRVPRDALLMRYSKVEKDGSYIPPSNAKLTYGAMVYIRALIVGDCGRSLSQVCTIAVRYSAVRRQTEIRPGGPEQQVIYYQTNERNFYLLSHRPMPVVPVKIEIGPESQVIDYQTQQDKLLPNVATTYALLFCGFQMLHTYLRITANIERGQMDELQVLHALSAGMKALSSDRCSTGIEKLRMSCGGHGYSNASGIPKIFVNITPACTYEGENTVMYLQCARYLVKCYGQAAQGNKLPGFMSYLNNPVKSSSNLDNSCYLPDLVEAYEHTAARLIQVAALKLQSLMKKGASIEEARNQTSVQLLKAAIAHSETYLVKTFVESVQRPEIDTDVRRVLEALCKLHAISGLNNRLGEFMQDGFISSPQAEVLLNKQLSLYAELRPNAVALVDAFDYPDQLLESCIGRYDGRVYEALYEYAKNSPLNKDEVMDSYYTTLRPLMKGQLSDNTPASRL